MTFEISTIDIGTNYKSFSEIDRRCFPNEPITSEADFEDFKKSRFLTAYDRDSFVGFAIFHISDNAHLNRIAVLDEYRRRGIGSLLMNRIMEECNENSISMISLSVQADNIGSIQFYKKIGFSEAGKSYQFVAPVIRTSEKARIKTYKPEDIPKDLSERIDARWKRLLHSHNPPHNFVLIFADESDRYRGFCRLSPSFPGCMPFTLVEPQNDLHESIQALTSFLSESVNKLIITISDKNIANACYSLGYSLNYELIAMELGIGNSEKR